MFDHVAAAGGGVGGVGSPAGLPLQHLEHSGSLAGVLGRRAVEAWLEGVTSQLFSVVWSVVLSLLRFGRLIDPQSPPLRQRCSWG